MSLKQLKVDQLMVNDSNAHTHLSLGASSALNRLVDWDLEAALEASLKDDTSIYNDGGKVNGCIDNFGPYFGYGFNGVSGGYQWESMEDAEIASKDNASLYKRDEADDTEIDYEVNLHDARHNEQDEVIEGNEDEFAL
jgi:hypothetical protein